MGRLKYDLITGKAPARVIRRLPPRLECLKLWCLLLVDPDGFRRSHGCTRPLLAAIRTDKTSSVVKDKHAIQQFSHFCTPGNHIIIRLRHSFLVCLGSRALHMDQQVSLSLILLGISMLPINPKSTVWSHDQLQNHNTTWAPLGEAKTAGILS